MQKKIQPDKSSTGSVSVIHRVMTILNLFSAQRTMITVEEIAAVLDMSAASAYRYASELTQGGLLSRSAGKFRLGPKIIELEYLISRYDPVISAAEDMMKGLAELTGCEVLLCNFYDKSIINVAHVRGDLPTLLAYTKGLPMPMFRGSQAHVMLAYMERRKLRRLYDEGLSNPEVAADVRAIGEDWTQFLAALKLIRERGHYISRGELDQKTIGFAAPVFGEQGEILSSLVLATDMAGKFKLSEKSLVSLVMQSGHELTQRIQNAR